MKKLLITFFVALFLTNSAFAYVDLGDNNRCATKRDIKVLIKKIQHRKNRRFAYKRLVKKYFKELNLSIEQQERIAKEVMPYNVKLRKVNIQIRKLRKMALKDIDTSAFYKDGKFDKESFKLTMIKAKKDLQLKLDKLDDERLDLVADIFDKIINILNREQKEKFLQFFHDILRLYAR